MNMDQLKTAISVVMLMMMSTNTLRAQDTIMYNQDPYYLTEEVDSYRVRVGAIYIKPAHQDSEYVNYLAADTRRQFIVQEPTPVYGIALTALPLDPGEWSNTSIPTGGLYVADAFYDAWGLKRRLQDYILTLEYYRQDGVIQTDTAHFYGDSLYFKIVRDGDSLKVPCYEYYFDTPHVLTGTFYVSITMEEETLLNYPREVSSDAIVFLSATSGDPLTEIIYHRHFAIMPDVQHDWTNDGGGLIPILQAGPHCGPVGGLRLDGRGEDWARFVWDDAGDSVEYQLVFGHDPAHPVNLYDTTYTISGLDSGRYYDVRLRRVCHHDCPYHVDTVVYSAYSAALRFWVGSTDPANMGVEAAETDGMGMTVYPNPSGGVVTIGVEHPEGASLEVRDAVGRTVVRMERIGRETHLDLSLLPRGVYTVTLDSPGGIATRRLVLQ